MSYALKVVRLMESLVQKPKRRLREGQDAGFVFQFPPQEYNGKSPSYDKIMAEIKNLSDPETARVADAYCRDLSTILYAMQQPDYTYEITLEAADIVVAEDNSGGSIYMSVTLRLDSEPSQREMEWLDPNDPDYEDNLEEARAEAASRQYKDLEDKLDRTFRDRVMGWDGEWNLEQDKMDYSKVTFTCDLFD